MLSVMSVCQSFCAQVTPMLSLPMMQYSSPYRDPHPGPDPSPLGLGLSVQGPPDMFKVVHYEANTQEMLEGPY